MESNHPGVKSIYQRNGAIHNSIVVCGAYKGNAAFVAVRGNSRKVHNLRRNPRCSVLSVTPDWRSFVIVESQAQLVASAPPSVSVVLDYSFFHRAIQFRDGRMD